MKSRRNEIVASLVLTHRGVALRRAPATRRRSTIFGEIRFDSVDFSQLADRALPRRARDAPFITECCNERNLARPDSPLRLARSPSPYSFPSLSFSKASLSDSASTATDRPPTTTPTPTTYYSYFTTARTRLLPPLSLLLLPYDTFIIAFIHRHHRLQSRPRLIFAREEEEDSLCRSF